VAHSLTAGPQRLPGDETKSAKLHQYEDTVTVVSLLTLSSLTNFALAGFFNSASFNPSTAGRPHLVVIFIKVVPSFGPDRGYPANMEPLVREHFWLYFFRGK
jgi:hypothetical protein